MTVETRQPTIECALAHVDDEIDHVRAERDSFEDFLDRLDTIQTNGRVTPRTDGNHAVVTSLEASAPTELQPIRRAYRETVMGVSHYEQEYGDTLRESLTVELGETVATYVMDGQILSPMVRDTLRKATNQCLAEREDFLRLLRQESGSLDAIANELNELEARVVEISNRIDATETSTQLARIGEKLQRTEQRCTALANRRQKRIHSRENISLSGVDSASLSQYLYTDMETVTPALADIASCIETIRYLRIRCLH